MMAKSSRFTTRLTGRRVSCVSAAAVLVCCVVVLHVAVVHFKPTIETTHTPLNRIHSTLPPVVVGVSNLDADYTIESKLHSLGSTRSDSSSGVAREHAREGRCHANIENLNDVLEDSWMDYYGRVQSTSQRYRTGGTVAVVDAVETTTTTIHEPLQRSLTMQRMGCDGFSVALCVPLPADGGGDAMQPGGTLLLLRRTTVERVGPRTMRLYPNHDETTWPAFVANVTACRTPFDIVIIRSPANAAARNCHLVPDRDTGTRHVHLANRLHGYHSYHGLLWPAGLLVLDAQREVAWIACNAAAGASQKQVTRNSDIRLVWDVNSLQHSRHVQEMWMMYRSAVLQRSDADSFYFECGEIIDYAEWVSFPPIPWGKGGMGDGYIERHGQGLFAQMRNVLLLTNVSAARSLDYRSKRRRVVYEERGRVIQDSRVRGVDPAVATRIIAELNIPGGHDTVDGRRNLSHASLAEQFSRVNAATHVLASEGAFLAWMMLAHPGTVFVCVYEHYIHLHPTDRFEHMQFFYPLLRMRGGKNGDGGISLVVVSVVHSKPVRATSGREYDASLAAVVPDIRLIRGAIRAADLATQRGDTGHLYFVTTSGVFVDAQPMVFK